MLELAYFLSICRTSITVSFRSTCERKIYFQVSSWVLKGEFIRSSTTLLPYFLLSNCTRKMLPLRVTIKDRNKMEWWSLQEHYISRDVLTNLDLDNNEVEESNSLAHFDDQSPNNVSSRQHVESSMKYEHDTDIRIGYQQHWKWMLELNSGNETKTKANLFLQPVLLKWLIWTRLIWDWCIPWSSPGRRWAWARQACQAASWLP